MESEEEQHFCNNCKRNVSSANFSIHSAFCERNIFVCKICDEPVPIIEKDEHLEEYHAISPCNLCEAPLEKWLLPRHMEICPKRLVECKYCEASFPLDEHTEHEEFCGSRTEKCLLCQKYIMNKDKSKHKEIHMLEKKCRAKEIEDEIKQNKVNEVISKKSTPERICEKMPGTIHSMPSRIREGKDACVSDKLESRTSREDHNLEIPVHGGGAASFPERETQETIHSMPSKISEEKDACVSDKLKSKTSRGEHNREIPTHRAGRGREISKHYTECHICKQPIPWIDFNMHVPACASSAGKCSLCAEYVPSYEMKEHMKSHFQGSMNKSLKVSEDYASSNESTYRNIQTNGAKSKTHRSMMKCPYCSEMCSEDQVLEHTRSCRKNMYECPLCSEKICEKDRKRHEQFECRMVQDSMESNTSDFSRHPQNCFECPLCLKQIPEENYDLHVSLQCENLSRVGGSHELYAAGEDLYICVYCSEKMPQKDKTMHHSFSCKVLIENSGISISGLDSYADITKKADHNSYKNDQSSETCPICKNTFSKWKISEHRNKCCRLKEPCQFCNLIMDVSCRNIHLKYCPGIDNRNHKTVAQDSRSSNYMHKGAIPKNTSIKDMMKPRSAKCMYCHTSYNVDILPNHEKECIHRPTNCELCGHRILWKDLNTHKCKRRKGKGNCQKMPQQVSQENSGDSFGGKIMKFFNLNGEKKDRGRQMFTESPSYYESQAYVPDSVEKNEKLYFEQPDNTLLPCEFCQQEFPASELVLHETGCEPHLVSLPKSDLPENSDSKKGSMQRDSAAFKSQNIHSAGGISHPFFAKNDSVLTRHDASEHIEHNRKSMTGELPQTSYDKKYFNHLENSQKNENDMDKKPRNFQSVWNVTHTSNFTSDHMKETLDDSNGKTEKIIILNEKQKEKEVVQQTPEKHSPNYNEMKTMITFLNEGKSESDEEFLSFSDENGDQENSEMKENSSMNPQKIIQVKQGESPLLKKITNGEKSKEVFQETLKSGNKAERNPEDNLKQLSARFKFDAHETTFPFESNRHCDIQSEKNKDLEKPSRSSEKYGAKAERNSDYLKQLNARFGFGAHKTTLSFEGNTHYDILSEKKYDNLEEPSRPSEISKNQKEYARHLESLSNLKLGQYQSVAVSGGANVNEMIDKELDEFLVKKTTKFSESCSDQKNCANSSRLVANLNLGSDALSFVQKTYFPVQTVSNDEEPRKLHEQKNPKSTYCTNDVKESFSYFKNDTNVSTILSNKLEHLKVLPKEHNEEPKELYNRNNSFFDTVGSDAEYIRNYRQYLPDFKFDRETVRKLSQDDVTNVTLPESKNVHNMNKAFTLEPAGSLKESKLPFHTVLKTGVKDVGLYEKIAALERSKLGVKEVGLEEKIAALEQSKLGVKEVGLEEKIAALLRSKLGVKEVGLEKEIAALERSKLGGKEVGLEEKIAALERSKLGVKEVGLEEKIAALEQSKLGGKEVGLEEKIAVLEQSKKLLSSGANNNTDDVRNWRQWREKREVSDFSDSD